MPFLYQTFTFEEQPKMTDKAELFDTVSDAHEAYKMTEKEVDKAMKRERLNRLASARETLSRVMHEAHTEGLPKDQIRRAVKAYNNSATFDPLWDAYTPDSEIDLRRTATGLKKDKGQSWWDGDDYIWVLSTTGREHRMGNAYLEKGYLRWDGEDSDLDILTGEEFQEVWGGAQKALTAEQANGGRA